MGFSARLPAELIQVTRERRRRERENLGHLLYFDENLGRFQLALFHNSREVAAFRKCSRIEHSRMRVLAHASLYKKKIDASAEGASEKIWDV